MELVKEKIVQLVTLTKAFVNEPCFSDYLITTFWGGLRDCILTKKALLPQEPDIAFGYLDYNYLDLYDDESYTVRITARVLRNKSRGRRSKLFYKEQIDTLEKYKNIYIDKLKTLIQFKQS